MGNTTTSKVLVAKGRFRQRVVICGSMSFYGDMIEAQNRLLAFGVPTVVPEPEDEYVDSLSDNGFNAFKRQASHLYLRKIRALETVAVLAVNRDKHGVRDYIGPNTFAEIAVAFAQSKAIFLLQGVPTTYADELTAWGGVALDGALEDLLTYYEVQASSPRQLEFFRGDDNNDGSLTDAPR